MKKQFLVLGAGRFGTSLAKKLMELKQEVLVVDGEADRIHPLTDIATWTLEADITNENNLREIIGARNFDVVTLAVGTDIQSSIMTAILLKDMGVKTLIAKANNDLHAKVLYKIGVDRVIFPEREMGARIAQYLVHENIFDYINLSEEFSLVEVKVPKGWLHESVREVDVKKNFGINIIGIKGQGRLTLDILPDTRFMPEDILVVVGRDTAIDELPQ